MYVYKSQPPVGARFNAQCLFFLHLRLALERSFLCREIYDAFLVTFSATMYRVFLFNRFGYIRTRRGIFFRRRDFVRETIKAHARRVRERERKR